MKIWAIISGILTGGFGLKKVWGIFKQVNKAKRIILEGRGVWKEGNELWKVAQEGVILGKKVMANNEVSHEEGIQCGIMLARISKEVLDLKKEVDELRAIFK